MSKKHKTAPKHEPAGDAPAETVAQEPQAVPAPEPNPMDVFRRDYLTGDKPLMWKRPLGVSYRILSKHGILLLPDGSEMVLDAKEATEIASRLQRVRPLDQIQIHTS